MVILSPGKVRGRLTINYDRKKYVLICLKGWEELIHLPEFQQVYKFFSAGNKSWCHRVGIPLEMSIAKLFTKGRLPVELELVLGWKDVYVLNAYTIENESLAVNKDVLFLRKRIQQHGVENISLVRQECEYQCEETPDRLVIKVGDGTVSLVTEKDYWCDLRQELSRVNRVGALSLVASTYNLLKTLISYILT